MSYIRPWSVKKSVKQDVYISKPIAATQPSIDAYRAQSRSLNHNTLHFPAGPELHLQTHFEIISLLELDQWLESI